MKVNATPKKRKRPTPDESRKGQAKGTQRKLQRKMVLMVRFAMEYVRDLNGTAAARRSGVGTEKAGEVARDWLQREDVKAMIQEQMEARDAHVLLQVDRTLGNIGSMAHADARDFLDPDTGRVKKLSDLPGHLTYAIQSLEVTENRRGARVTKIRLVDKLEANKLLAAYQRILDEARNRARDAGSATASMSMDEIDRELADAYARRQKQGLLPDVITEVVKAE